MSAPAPAIETRRIPLALIADPVIAMRETMSEDGLESLAASLRELGQLQPIGVIPEGEHYRIVWGHRRRVAAARAGLPDLECKVFPAGTELEEAMKVAENDEQEAVGPASEATYYAWLFEHRCGADVERVAALVKKPLSRVLDRLDLLRGDPEILQALREEKINMAVARELNKVPDQGYRRLFLADAQRFGATARVVRQWNDELRTTLRRQEAAKDAGLVSTEGPAIASIVSMDACALCGRDSDQHEMEYRKVHGSCYRFFRRQQEAPAGSSSSS